MFRLARPLLLPALLAACAPAVMPNNATPRTAEVLPAATDTSPVGEGVTVSRWMLDPKGQPASWLNTTLAGRGLREPINIILIDERAATPEEAAARLLDAATRAGYGPKGGHSTGYSGVINGERYAQQPAGNGEAFSDAPWWGSNNHGRVFGPARTARGFVWIASFSREDFALFARMHHPYNSFRVARDDFARRMTDTSDFKAAGSVDLGNALNTPTLTTDDHDGQAVLLVAPGH
ncbi:hypothetical protein [Deinococcus maricopensis]|uniref:Lipoprotein n=1 Tax=Deinococcus maricopensis (strain DSM 21211 / LMG 22137 / NRRL B-23946 / LB-34) TaxID=709986 RepID=E8U9S4_DEIML|nr:hypothetical protein [Deinococcus maricopensis]ADV67813.1 hypothetical protein Deima_2173 [Deinococcus maricopensis DSM 21211]